ncbi:copper chaperone [Paracoccus sp. YIM 132242]|uniref:Copper chaperone n=1 Tax=Paracoccus lichenicola TaxID=2665644 RepID=A0A6L6HM05_9RHOB|nr:heavy-metal-associated domain-containing protein [Paracoccus lichenicola]MTD99202.1 copper chaperone [Paracoccus lichenicola]
MTFTVPDMSCGHCKAAVEAAIAEAGGRAAVDLATKTVTVEGLDPARAADVIRAAGYEVAVATS